MKFTSEDLAKILGIKIGDKIKYTNGEVADVIKDYILDFKHWRIGLHILVDEDFEIVRPKKKVGEKLCDENYCDCCPLNIINYCLGLDYLRLYEILDRWYENYKDDEIYNILKSRLDKEIE